jgi:hypothetical protein
MSRSLHTDPRTIRAVRRILDPRAPRSAGDRHHGSAQGKEAGSESERCVAAPLRPQALPLRIRVTEAPARPGFLHPARRLEVLRFLRGIEPQLLYGMREVALIQAREPPGAARHIFGRYLPLGRVELYEQPMSPWVVLGKVPPAQVRRLRRAGATVRVDAALGTTRIEWPGAALRRFFLHDVLLHELGHHLLQHEKGRGTGRVARTRDHEACADAAVRRHTDALLPERGGSLGE